MRRGARLAVTAVLLGALAGGPLGGCDDPHGPPPGPLQPLPGPGDDAGGGADLPDVGTPDSPPADGADAAPPDMSPDAPGGDMTADA